MDIEKGKEIAEIEDPRWGSEPKNNFNPKTGLYKYKQIANRNWVIRCHRVKRNGVQCNVAAKSDSRSHRCHFHRGGARPVMRGNQHGFKHGKCSLAKLKQAKDDKVMISYLEDALRMLFTPEKLPRNVPNSPFRPFRSVEKAIEYLYSIGYDESHW
jgi:hypothetical protein